VDPKALDLAQAVLASAVDTVTTIGAPFPAFAMVDRGEERALHRFITERLEESMAAARAFAADQTDADAAAFAYDGYIPFETARFDAILVESWNFRAHRGVRLGLRYQTRGRLRKGATLIGGPLQLTSSGWVELEF
jgi:hypothetical protein